MTLNDIIVSLVWHFFMKPLAWASSTIGIMDTPISVLVCFVLLHLFIWGVIASFIGTIFKLTVGEHYDLDETSLFSQFAWWLPLAATFGISVVLQLELFGPEGVSAENFRYMLSRGRY